MSALWTLFLWRWDPWLKAADVAVLLSRLVAIIDTCASGWGCCCSVQTSDSALALVKTMSGVNCLSHQLHFKLLWSLALCHQPLIQELPDAVPDPGNPFSLLPACTYGSLKRLAVLWRGLLFGHYLVLQSFWVCILLRGQMAIGLWDDLS